MKTLTCKQMGGCCDEKFHAETFEEMANLSKQHGMEMFAQGDEAHLKIMQEMKAIMSEPGAMEKYIAEKKKLFDETPEDK